MRTTSFDRDGIHTIQLTYHTTLWVWYNTKRLHSLHSISFQRRFVNLMLRWVCGPCFRLLFDESHVGRNAFIIVRLWQDLRNGARGMCRLGRKRDGTGVWCGCVRALQQIATLMCCFWWPPA